MTPLLLIALSLVGGVGASVRFVVDGAIRNSTRAGYPLGTMLINVSGSFLLGLLTGLVLSTLVDTQWQLVLGTGFLGGYTTFSTASFETIRLARERRCAAAFTNSLGVLAVAVAAAALGLWVGTSA